MFILKISLRFLPVLVYKVVVDVDSIQISRRVRDGSLFVMLCHTFKQVLYFRRNLLKQSTLHNGYYYHKHVNLIVFVRCN